MIPTLVLHFPIAVPVVDPGFPREGRQLLKGVCQPIILPNFCENSMKMKEFGPGGCASLPPTPIRHWVHFNFQMYFTEITNHPPPNGGDVNLENDITTPMRMAYLYHVSFPFLDLLRRCAHRSHKNTSRVRELTLIEPT